MSDLGNITFVKGSLRYKRAPEVPVQITAPLSGKIKELDEYERNITIDLAEVYDLERQKSTFFAPSCKFQLIFANTYSGATQTPDNPYPPFNNNLYYINPESTKLLQVVSSVTLAWPGLPQYNEFNFIRTDMGVEGYTTGTGRHITGLPRDVTNYNWRFYLSYPSYSNPLKNMQYDFLDGTIFDWQPFYGLPYQMNLVSIEGKTFWQFTCPVKHNLQVGEYVNLTNVTIIDGQGVPVTNGGLFEVYSLGNGFFNSEEKIFNIVDTGTPQNVSTFEDGKKGQFFRVIDADNPIESQSRYYIREHTILTNVNDSIVTNSGFEQTAFRTVKKWESGDLTPNQESRISIKEDSQSYNVSFNSSINIATLVDNLNRPLSELFVTVVNRGYFGYFNPPTQAGNALKEGWGFNLGSISSSWWERDNFFSDTNILTSSYTIGTREFFYNNDLVPGDLLNGDLCEWNDITQTETVLSDCYHKFVFNQEIFNIGSSLQNPLGYYYKPFFPLQIKDYGDYIEEGDPATVDGVPSYAFFSQYLNRFLWRDIYPYGYVDSDGNGVNFPFMNGRHYPYDNFIFRIIPEGTNILNIIDVQLPTIDGCE
jgi:hypothetical protein